MKFTSSKRGLSKSSMHLLRYCIANHTALTSNYEFSYHTLELKFKPTTYMVWGKCVTTYNMTQPINSKGLTITYEVILKQGYNLFKNFRFMKNPYTVFIVINAPSLLIAPPPSSLPLQSSYFGVLHLSQQPTSWRFRKMVRFSTSQANIAYEK